MAPLKMDAYDSRTQHYATCVTICGQYSFSGSMCFPQCCTLEGRTDYAFESTLKSTIVMHLVQGSLKTRLSSRLFEDSP